MGLPSTHKDHATQSSGRKDEKKVGVWIRVSTEEQARGDSPEHHEHRARSYADSRDWEVVEVYHLEGVSGKSVVGHPETRRMQDDIRRGHISGLIFSKLARLARNTKELLDFSDFFRHEGADLISLEESIDTSTPHGRLFYTMIAAMAQWEREEIGARVAASIPVRAKLGKRISGAAPFGYQWKDNRLLIDSTEAPIRRLMYELFKEHRRIRTVARLLTQAGYRMRSGAAFDPSTVRRMIEDPLSKGLRRANYSRNQGGKLILKPESEWIWTEVEPIVSSDLWDDCNAILAERKANWKRPAKKPVHLFAGVTVCVCGRKMYVPSNTPKYVCQGCRNKIPIVDLETIFHTQLREFCLHPDEVSRYLAQGDQVIGEKKLLLEGLMAERERVSAEMDKLYRLYLEDRLSSESFGRRHRPLEERAGQLDTEIPKLQGEIDYLTINHLSREDILSQAEGLYTGWPTLPFEVKRTIVENVIEAITVGKDEVNIDLSYLPSLPEIMANGVHTPPPTRIVTAT